MASRPALCLRPRAVTLGCRRTLGRSVICSEGEGHARRAFARPHGGGDSSACGIERRGAVRFLAPRRCGDIGGAFVHVCACNQSWRGICSGALHVASSTESRRRRPPKPVASSAS